VNRSHTRSGEVTVQGGRGTRPVRVGSGNDGEARAGRRVMVVATGSWWAARSMGREKKACAVRVSGAKLGNSSKKSEGQRSRGEGGAGARLH